LPGPAEADPGAPTAPPTAAGAPDPLRAPPTVKTATFPADDRTECVDPAARETRADGGPPTELTGLSASIAPTQAAALPPVPGHVAVKKLGEGSYGQVWLYEEVRTGIRVAIKFFARAWGLEWQLLQAEVKQLAMMHADPGIVQLLDVEPESNPPYYVMSYAAGGSLAQRLKGRQGLPLADALRIFRQVTAALAYVHAKGIRHCDLKPGNILLDSRGRALIGDFGQAHLGSESSPALGTFFYMAPEQADLANTIPDMRWDVYGLGALFYAMLTGAPPREEGAPPAEPGRLSLAEKLARYREAVRRAARPNAHRRVAGMDRALAVIIDRCLEVDPQRRFRDAGAVLEALARRDRAQRRRPLLLFGLAAPLLLVLVMTALGYWSARRQIDNTAEQLEHQLQESDRLGARLVASVIQESMQDRIELMQEFRDDSEHLLIKVKESRGGEIADEDRRTLRDALAELHSRGKERKFFHQYALADKDGYLLAVYPRLEAEERRDEKGRRRRWAFRDWFNGERDKPDPDDRSPPLRKLHVSQPYVSTVPNSPELAINVSLPLVDRHGAGYGVLTGQVWVKDLHAWLARLDIRDGFVVLLNERGQCLLHRSADNIKPRTGESPVDWRPQCELYNEALAEEHSDGLADYADPVDGKRYLAGYSRFRREEGRRGVAWLALVQHDRAAVLKPVSQLERNLRFNCGVGLLVGLLLTVGLWGWMVLTLGREEGIPQT
jgi:serine/threonine protein kinase